MGDRPELQAPPEIFYNETEARKYTSSSRIIEIQSKLTERAIEMLLLPDDGVPRMLLDIGCGSGLSGKIISEHNHMWMGVDISTCMLDVAREEEAEGDLILADMGQGLGFRPGMFDGAISISAVQWLCNADKSSHDPRKRLKAFFTSLYSALVRGARAVLQIYPQNAAQVELITSAAMRCGFSGGIVVDYPHSSSAKKHYLCLVCGPPSVKAALPKAKLEEDSEAEEEDEEQTVKLAGRERAAKRRKVDKKVKGRGWILEKKQKQRTAGHVVPMDTKYTGRKRKPRF